MNSFIESELLEFKTQEILMLAESFIDLPYQIQSLNKDSRKTLKLLCQAFSEVQVFYTDF